jgi:hypothetical protein
MTRLALASIVAVQLLLAGCGGAEEPPPAPVLKPVAPEYASADALLTHVKGLLNADPPQLESFYSVIFWDSPAQNVYKEMVQSFNVPRAKFLVTAHGRYDGDGIKKRKLQLEPITIGDDVTVTPVGDDGATATFMLGNDEHTLHLRQVDRRWWVSGQTVEETPLMVCPEHALSTQKELYAGTIRQIKFTLEPMGYAYTLIMQELATKSDDELADFIKQKIETGILDYATRANLPNPRSFARSP